jgi:hypothetical protein
MIRRICCLVALAVILPSAMVACTTTSGCEEALDQTRKLTQEICDKDTAYGATPFCSICVKAGYLSTSGPTDCRCTLLAYNQGVCAIPSDDEAKSSIRDAIKWANESCTTFTFAPPDGEGGQGGTPP